MRKGFSLVELLVVAAIGLIIFAGVLLFFSSNYRASVKTVVQTKANVSIFQSLNLINADLVKAGYGIEDTSKYPPVLWNAAGKELIIRYVDYDKEGCDDETYGTNDCSFVVIYKLDTENEMLDRAYYRNGVTDVTFFPLFNDRVIRVKDFSVSIDSYSHKVEYTIELEVGRKNYSISDVVICRNWKE